MKFKHSISLFVGLVLASIFMISCGENNDDSGLEPLTAEMDFVSLLTNQVDEVIIPSMTEFQSSMTSFLGAAVSFSDDLSQENLTRLVDEYQNAYLSYQAAAVHNYFATANQALVVTTNLYPVDINLLATFIENQSFNFNTSAQERANGFPALDFMFFGNENTLQYFQEDSKRVDFLVALVQSIKDRSDILVSQWTGSLRGNFITNGGTELGSSISVQLNDHIGYYENHIRENKVGIPIGRLGPNDDLIEADGTKIEAYYQSLVDGDDRFALQLLRAAVEEVEDLYFGTTTTGENEQGYDDLVITFSNPSINEDITARFNSIYSVIDSRTNISGDESLYDAIQEIVTLYKSDLFPVLNVQDADGANDGD